MQPTELVADTICRTVELGVTITGAAIGEAFTHIECRPVVEDPMCPSCGHCGKLRDHVTRTLTDLPVVGHPTRLQVRLPRFVCEQDSCAVSVFRQRIDRVAAPKASTTRRTARWILHCLAVEKMSVSAVAKVLGVSWDVVNSSPCPQCTTSFTPSPGIWTRSESSGWTSINGNMFADRVIRVS
ncbi:hypothetical protein GCM10020255_004050 [Rhodococcus baikonurensis]